MIAFFYKLIHVKHSQYCPKGGMSSINVVVNLCFGDKRTMS